MKLKLVIASVLTAASLMLPAQSGYRVGWRYAGQAFSEFVSEAEKQFNVKFLYDEKWIQDLRLGSYGETEDLYNVLDSLFRGSSLRYYPAQHGNIVLTNGYYIKLLNQALSPAGKYVPALPATGKPDEAQISTGISIEIGNPSEKGRNGNATLSGYIHDQDTRQPVAGATVYVPGLSAGTVSNSFGYYSISLPRGRHTLRFTFIGMKEKSYDVSLFSSGELNLGMKSVLVPLKGAVITAEKDITLRRTETGVEKVSLSTLRLQPATMGETDIVRSLLMIPGVNTVGEGSAGFNVRGGAADQNLLLLYGAPLYNSSHFFGFFSSVNTDVISDMTLYKGGIPSRFGGRLSSVIDIQGRDGNRKEFRGNAGLSPLMAHLSAEGPIINDTLTWLLAGRTTYSDWILGIIDDPSLKKSSAAFSDLNGRIAWEPGRRDKIDLSAYYSRDAFRLNSDTVYRYRNNIISLRWRHQFSSRLFSTITLNNSNYMYKLMSNRVATEAFSISHSVNSTGLKPELNLFAGRHTLNLGADLTYYSVNPGSYMPAGDSSLVLPRETARERAAAAAIFVEDQMTVNDFLVLSGGLRLSSFVPMGPSDVLVYDGGHPREPSSVTDTISYSPGKFIKLYGGPELRLSVNIRIDMNNSFKLNYNRTLQYIHLMTNSAAIAPTDTWKLSDYNTGPQTGDQYAAGFYHLFRNNKVEFSAETYYKDIINMPDFKDGAEVLMNEHIEQQIAPVNGKAYGLELLLRKPEGRIRWDVGYTWSRILVRSTGIFDEEKINSGKLFPANFDRPHNLLLSFYYIYSRRVSISATYNYSSGRPVTYPVTSYSLGNIVLTHYSERNRYRLPYYSRLDLSVKISGNLKSDKIAHPHWIFSVYNLMGRNNVYTAFFRNDRNRIKGYYLSVFDRPVPTLSFNFDF